MKNLLLVCFILLEEGELLHNKDAEKDYSFHAKSLMFDFVEVQSNA